MFLRVLQKGLITAVITKYKCMCLSSSEIKPHNLINMEKKLNPHLPSNLYLFMYQYLKMWFIVLPGRKSLHFFKISTESKNTFFLFPICIPSWVHCHGSQSKLGISERSSIYFRCETFYFIRVDTTCVTSCRTAASIHYSGKNICAYI